MNPKETAHHAQEIQSEPKRFLYKGINIHAFEHYFKNGGIAPLDPKVGWLTDSPERAHDVAYSMRFKGFTSRPSPAYCLISLDYNFLFEHTLEIHQRYGTMYGHYVDFNGQATIGWGDIKAVITTKEGEQAIEAIAQETEFPLWSDLQRKIVHIQDPVFDQEPHFIDEILQLNRRRLI